MSEFDFIAEQRKNIPESTKIFVKKNFDILDDLSERIGVRPPVVSKWLNGTQNFTLKTLSKLEAALGEEIIQITKR